MQPTVSIIIACFNKEKYIGELLESVINQTWRKLQLVIVDDGSSDGTREIISNYISRLAHRGIDTILIEQQNSGVATAISNGLQKATGDFICMPDADDVLCSLYVESMVTHLIENPNLDWAVCDSDRTRWTQCVEEYVNEPCNVSIFENLLERYILMCNYGMAWQLIIRKSYADSVGIADCLKLLGWTTTHEAPVWIPIIVGGGQGIYVPSRLYIFRDTPASLSNPGSVEKVLAYSRRYKEAIITSLKFCNITDEKFYFLAILREFEEILTHAPELKEYACRKLSDILIRNGHIGKTIDHDTLFVDGENPCYGFYHWLWNGYIPKFYLSPKGDVIAYGALGIRATRLLPLWNSTRWKPTKLWDKLGSGTLVSKPDFETLKQDDTILVFPANDDVINEVQVILKDTTATVLYKKEMDMLLEKLQYLSFPTWSNTSKYYIGVEL